MNWRPVTVIVLSSFVASAHGNVIVNGDFEHGLSGWDAEVHGSASATVVGAIASNALLLAAGSINQAGDASVTQALPPIQVNDIKKLSVSTHIAGVSPKPYVLFNYTDGSSSGSFFGTAATDPFTWFEEDLKQYLTSGKVLKSIKMRIADSIVVNPVFAYIDNIVLETVTPSPKNLLQNPGFEQYSLYGPQNTQANFVSWTEGPTPPTSIPFANTYAAYPQEFGPVNRSKSSNLAYVLGGNIATSFVTQYVKPLGRSDEDIDSGGVNFSLAAWMGGFSKQDDDAVIELTFLSESNSQLGNVLLGPVTAANRGNRTRMQFASTTGVVPPLTRAMSVKVEMRRFAGVTNNGCADDISLVLFGAPAKMRGDGTIPGYTGAPDSMVLNAALLDPITSNVVAEAAVRWGADGSFAFEAPVPAGTYDIALRAPNSLRTVIKNIRVADGGAAEFDFNLVLGDINQDNYIGTDDYLVLNASFDSTEADPEFDARADLTGDKYVGTDDYLILNSNFDTPGD